MWTITVYSMYFLLVCVHACECSCACVSVYAYVCMCVCARTEVWGSEQLWERPVLPPGEAGSPCVLRSFHQLNVWAFSLLCPPPCQWSTGSRVCGIASGLLFIYIFALWDFHTMYFYSTGFHPQSPPQIWLYNVGSEDHPGCQACAATRDQLSHLASPCSVYFRTNLKTLTFLGLTPCWFFQYPELISFPHGCSANIIRVGRHFGY